MPYFLLYLFIETLVSVAIASNLGGLLTFVEILLSAVVGVVIIQNFNYSLRDNLESAARGQISMQEFQRMNLASMLGAVLLVVPGFFTDIVGILLQFEKFSTMIARRFLHLKNKDKEQEHYDPFQKEGDNDVIDVEVIDSDRTGDK